MSTQTTSPPPSRVASPLLRALLALTACGGGDGTPGMGAPGGGGPGANATALKAALLATPVQALSATEAQGLAAMREEEQLAHAVYSASA